MISKKNCGCSGELGTLGPTMKAVSEPHTILLGWQCMYKKKIKYEKLWQGRKVDESSVT